LYFRRAFPADTKAAHPIDQIRDVAWSHQDTAASMVLARVDQIDRFVHVRLEAELIAALGPPLI
jgi:hypothetical protein